MSLAQEDRAAGWQRDVGQRNQTVASLLKTIRKQDAQIERLEAELAAYRGPARRRLEAAAERDVPLARELLRYPGLTEGQRLAAYQRWQCPEWSWTQIGHSLGMTKDQARMAFRRAARRAGLL